MKIIIAIAGIVGLLAIVGCSKKMDTVNKAERFFKIVFNPYASVDKIDSVVVLWSTPVRPQRISFKPSSDMMQVNIDSLQQGSGMFTVQLFSRLKLDTLRLQWEKQMQFNFQLGNSIVVRAPDSFRDTSWYPRIIFEDHRFGLRAIVGIRPSDPYFELNSIDPKWSYLTVSRNYYDTLNGHRLAVGEWICNSGCYNESGSVINRSHFAFLPAAIGVATWKAVELHARFSQSWAMNRNFHLNYQYE